MPKDQAKVIHTKTTFHKMSRRMFLHLSMHLSILRIRLPIKRTTAARAMQTAPQLDGYGSGAYGQEIYPGPTPSNHRNYLPIVSKKE